MEVSLGEIVSSHGSQVERQLYSGGKSCGKIIFVTEEVTSSREVATMQFYAKKLDRKDFFGRSDPFLTIKRCNEDSSYTVVHRTEFIKRTLNPVWKPFSIHVSTLCNGDYDRMLRIECYDWNQSGNHNYIGSFATNLRTLALGPGPSNEYECINETKKAKKRRYKHSGMINLMGIEIVNQPTFLDYIQGGTQINFTVAIDFTASNGDPSEPQSLHYMYSPYPNVYTLAIKSVGEIIQDYDSDKLFPALGFGARLPPDGVVSHEFPLNGNMSNPFCVGIDGILEAYKQKIGTVQLYGPTNFSPVINHVSRFASAYRDGSQYFVLLIITDGIISDMSLTKEAIVHAATLPMSIIIVGVGNADFSAMEELDGDVVRLSSKGKFAERDIVQFVPFREFLSGENWSTSQVLLAKEVLAELPDQFLEYMKKHNIKPKPKPQAPVASAPCPS
ncbi:copine-5-like isoform X3 [Centruroides vittatus]